MCIFSVYTVAGGIVLCVVPLKLYLQICQITGVTGVNCFYC